MTLPFSSRYSIAVAERIEGSDIEIHPHHKTKSRDAARLFLSEIGYSGSGMRLTVRSNIPEGFGLGSSTTDIIATIRAAAKFVGWDLKASTIFQLAVRAETASDGTMFSGKPRLVCQREGTVLERYKQKLPAFSLISVNVAPDDPVDTLIHPPARYTDDEIAQFSDLRTLLRRSLRHGSLRDLGEVTTRSAIINQRRLPQPHFDALLQLSRSAGVFGIQVAHSGRMIGILLDPRVERDAKVVQHIQAELLQLNMFTEFYRSPHR